MPNTYSSLQMEDQAILCIAASDRWHGPWKGRHQIISRLLKKNTVLFIEDPSLTILSLFRDYKRINRLWSWLYVRKESKNLYLYTPLLCLPFGNKIKLINRINNLLIYVNIFILLKVIKFKPTILYLCHFSWDLLAGVFEKPYKIYNAHDAWDVYPAKSELRRYNYLLEAKTIKRVDLALFTAKQNMERKKHLNPNSFYLPQGCPSPPEILFKGSLPDKPNDLPDDNRPIIGYWGTIDKGSVDIQLVEALSSLRKDLCFVFLGTVVKPDTLLFSRLQKKDNVFFLGRKALEQRYNYLCHFSVGVLCAQMTEMELLGSQLKIWEYISAGIPVVSIPIEEYKEFGDLVLTANSLSQWSEKIDDAINANNKAMVKKRLFFAQENSWDNRVNQLSKLISLTGSKSAK